MGKTDAVGLASQVPSSRHEAVDGPSLQQHRESLGRQADYWREQLANQKEDFFTPGWRLEHPRLAHAQFHSSHPYAHHAWGAATWVGLTTWMAVAWSQPVYYGYGEGGNVVYEGDTVYVQADDPVSAEQYAAEAAEIAQTGDTAQLSADAWMPLGVFALVQQKQTEPPEHFLQLAVQQDGSIGGIYYDRSTEETTSVVGAVDPESQRAAWRIGDASDIVMETGVYNLTQDETQVLIHNGRHRSEVRLLVRLPAPEAI